ncbi:hypothetical protein EDB85DRAFT_2142389 [Lactarius pseudohatsudake]|nr:hypothetical protein EDB85DRAFT_2142389 [Lactarius pseudohatsudake]
MHSLETPNATPGAHHPAAAIPILVGGADSHVVQTVAHALTGATVSVAQVTRDAQGPPLVVCHMPVDADKIDNNGVTKGKAVAAYVEGPHVDSGTRCGPPDALSVATAAAGSAATGGAGDDSDGTDSNGGRAEVPRPSAAHEPAENAPALTQDSTAGAEEIEKLTPEGHCTRHPSSPRAPSRRPLPPPSMSSTPCSSRSPPFAHDARPVVQVAVVFPTHADVVAHQPHCTVGEEDKRRRRAEEREAQQAAELEAANAGKTITVTELWKPHLSTLPRFEDLGLDTAAPYPLADVKSTLFTYAEEHDLVNRFEQQFTNTSSDAVFSAALHSSNAKGTFETVSAISFTKSGVPKSVTGSHPVVA